MRRGAADDHDRVLQVEWVCEEGRVCRDNALEVLLSIDDHVDRHVVVHVLRHSDDAPGVPVVVLSVVSIEVQVQGKYMCAYKGRTMSVMWRAPFMSSVYASGRTPFQK